MTWTRVDRAKTRLYLARLNWQRSCDWLVHTRERAFLTGLVAGCALSAVTAWLVVLAVEAWS